MTARLAFIRVIVVVTAILGVDYVAWRWGFSIRWSAWYIAVPLVLAETYSLIDSLLFGLTMWRLRDRPKPPPPPPDLTVDIFITTYNEPLDLVVETARAAKAIRYPHQTWILDDGDRPEFRDFAESAGIGWISRSGEWVGKPRHAKAGNLNNALARTTGEFLLILDADQVPAQDILDKVLGYFTDAKVALVQTPQYFVNVPKNDPLGSQAPLFYGPIQQGKDGWNAAFFCGSNAVLRREALLQVGITRYVKEMEQALPRALRAARRVLDQALRTLAPGAHGERTALLAVREQVAVARRSLEHGEPLAEITWQFQREVTAIARRVVERDVAALNADLAALAELGGEDGLAADLVAVDDAALDRLARRDWSPIGALEAVRALIEAVDVDRGDEAQAVMPMSTISVTEDMATCMRLHGLGWRTVYHDEVLATGLAPEDVGSMLTQRLRWAQGTVQVMLRENPLVQRGLTVPQRLMYWATMWSYFAGFAAVVYIVAPVLYLLFGIMPVQAFSSSFFERLLPFLAVNQLLFIVVADGRPTWRGQQYSLALFPIWIKSVTTAVGNVFFGRSLGFAVTPKVRQEGRPPWGMVRYQLVAGLLLVVSAIVGIVKLATTDVSRVGVIANLIWVAFDLVVFSVVVEAVRYRGFTPAPDAAAQAPAGDAVTRGSS